MIKRIDHVALAVRDRTGAKRFFIEGLGAREVSSQPAASADFHWTLLELGDSCLLEIIDPIGPKSFLHRFLEQRGDGAHHITFHVDDLEETRQDLEAKGIPTFGFAAPYPGWKELYVHPRDAYGILLQFAEFHPLDWVEPEEPVPAPYQGFADEAKSRAVNRVLQLGDPRLRKKCRSVDGFRSPELTHAGARLKGVLAELRAALGFGRAIAAPQIGLELRLIALDLGEDSSLESFPELMINPEITWRSDQTFTLWDDCLSFPNLLVKVERHASLSVRYQDEQGHTHQLERLGRTTSELLQHEIDHLDGILAVDHAVDRDSLVSRDVFVRMRDHFLAQVSN